MRWSYDIRQDGDQAYFHGELLFVDDLVLVATDGEDVGHIYAFAWATGEVRWKYDANQNVPSDVVRVGNTVFALTQADTLLALDANSGALRWSFASRGDRAGRAKFVSSPVVVGSRAYFSARDGSLYALDAEDGTVVWTRDLGTSMTSSPVVGDGELYVGTADGRILRLDADSGELRSQFTIDEPVSVGYSLTVTPEGLLVPSRRGGGPSAWALIDRQLESVRWRRDNADVWSIIRPHLWDGAVVLGDGAGNAFVLDLRDGVARHTLEAEGSVRSVGSAGDVLYIGTLEGPLYAYRVP